MHREVGRANDLSAPLYDLNGVFSEVEFQETEYCYLCLYVFNALLWIRVHSFIHSFIPIILPNLNLFCEIYCVMHENMYKWKARINVRNNSLEPEIHHQNGFKNSVSIT